MKLIVVFLSLYISTFILDRVSQKTSRYTTAGRDLLSLLVYTYHCSNDKLIHSFIQYLNRTHLSGLKLLAFRQNKATYLWIIVQAKIQQSINHPDKSIEKKESLHISPLD
jgi:hypothetical protein